MVDEKCMYMNRGGAQVVYGVHCIQCDPGWPAGVHPSELYLTVPEFTPLFYPFWSACSSPR